jgi:hypothetical protein
MTHCFASAKQLKLTTFSGFSVSATGKPSPGNQRLVHIFDLLHAGFTGSIDDTVLTARLLSQEPLENYV